MRQRWATALRLVVATAVGCWATVLAVGSGSAHADVSAVTGSAFGVSSSVSLFGSPAINFGAAPSVTLPAGGSATPLTGSAAAEDDTVAGGMAHLFTSGPISVSTVGAPPSTNVMSSVTVNPCVTAVNNSCTAGQIYNGPFTTTGTISATCSATGASPTASVTINGGQLASGQSPNTTTSPVPTNPAPNTTKTGVNPDTGMMFKYVFNEQNTNADGSLTVNAVHEFLQAGSSGAQGDLFIGQVVCGAKAAATTTTTMAPGATTTTTTGSTTTTAAAATTTTTAAAATTTSTTSTSTTSTSAATTTTTLPVIDVGGSAFGYYSIVSLFGGPSAVRGPTPSVTLPSGGSATPVTDHADTGAAIYGPAHIFESGPITVSTQGQSGTAGSVTSSTSIQGCTTADPSGAGNGCDLGQIFGGAFTASNIASTCTAGARGITGSTTIAGGKVVTLDDASGNPVTTVSLPDPIPPNYSVTGTITEVNGGFKWVFNEQTTNANGSLTVNAAHEYLGFSGSGPAKGDLILGESVCAKALSTTTRSGAGSGSGLATTGDNLGSLVRLALVLLLVGCAALGGTRQDELELPSSPE